MENLTLSVSKMHCATCAQKIEKELSSTKGILGIVVNFSNEQASLTFDEQVIDEKKIIKIIEKIGYFAEINVTENERQKERKKEMKIIALKLILATLFALITLTSPFYKSYIPILSTTVVDSALLLLTLVVVYIGAKGVLKSAFNSFKNLKIDPQLLRGTGLAIFIAYAFLLVMFPSMHKELSRFTVLSTINVVSIVILTIEWIKLSYEAQFKESYEALIGMQPKRARVVRHGTEMELDIAQIKIGDIIKVKPGEKVPVDGIIIEGSTEVNEMMIVGTINPTEKSVGDEVITGTINGKNTIIIKTTQVGENNTVNQIISHVSDAKKYPSSKEKNARTMEKVFTIVSLVISLGLLVFWTVWGAPFFVGLFSACSFLLIANPELFTQGTFIPITFAIERLALNGIVFKGGRALEIANNVDHVIFDKTGILTKGTPEINNIVSKPGFNEKRFLILIGSLENASTHPFGEAIVNYVKNEKIEIKKPSGVKTLEGLGILGIVDGEEVIAGNMRLMEKSNVQMNEELVHKADILSKNVKTPIYVARNRELIGIIGIADSIKEFSKEAIMMLKKGNYKLTLITGDNSRIAEYIAEEVRIKSVVADLVQHEKSEYIASLQEKGDIVAFVGNGINDAPILAQANLGMASGAGNNVGLEESDVTLLSDNLLHVDKALTTSKKIFRTVNQNFWFSISYNTSALIVVSGIIYPTFNVILHPIFAPIIMGAYNVWMLNKTAKIKQETSFNF